ncbi:NADPH-dependent FMN reductase [Candidatus Promineifilum breve]|uniref:NADPH-dependent FMN reductase n=1 Tax=Candidatus Promineifilum breve TaxID=1806508 RepID=A0A160SZ98_9CHLR|nr:NAD(P)H-dependent oxidoreductase [Candidatus Promineifilum breve]CUS02039.2 NADPH-dependent FMN reductase [Candidatus Promineifilum breve]
MLNQPDDNGVNPAREPISFLVFAASLRTGSLNAKLARLAADTIESHGGTVDYAFMTEFDVPSYDQDVQDGEGFPPGAQQFYDRLNKADAFVIASPEYNASFPGVLKNLIDWVSRFKPQPFNFRNGMLLSASPSMSGGNRGLWSLRIPLEHLGARIYPDMFSLAQAHQGLDSNGQLLNPQLGERFEKTVVAYMDLVEADIHYHCAKKAWFEYLGEPPTAETERAE